MKKTSFVGSKLKECHFTQTVLVEANFQETDLMGTVFHNCDLTQTNFVRAIHYAMDPQANKIKKAKFSLPEAMELLRGFDIVIEK